MTSEGVELIATERQRQIEEEDWTPEHDDEHTDGSLALAAICYAAPTTILVPYGQLPTFMYYDPWPDSWDGMWDKRTRYGSSRDEPDDGVLPKPETYSYHERLDLLTKAGALIAAEIDRLVRAQAKENPK